MNVYPSGRLELDVSQLQRLLASIPFAVVVFSGPEHTAVFSNAAHDELTRGRVRLGVPFVQSIPELAGQPTMQVLDDVYATGEGQQTDELPARLMRNGQLEDCWFQVTWQAVRDANGRVTGVIASAIEVTQHVRNRQVRNSHDREHRNRGIVNTETAAS